MPYFISKTQPLSRRTFLRGTGVAMGLPLLNAMLPANGLAAGPSQSAPLRTAFVFFPNGAIMPQWNPTGDGANYELSPTLKPLQDFKSDMLVISNLAQDNGRAKGDGPGDHARSAATFLTGMHPVKTAGADIRVGVSIDQVIAQKVGAQTRLPSLELGLEAGRTAGSCDSGYSCAYSSTISWKSATTPMAKEINPALVFERLFGSGANSPEQAAKRAKFRRSILDAVADDASQLKTQLGQTDRRKMDEFFTSVREIEERLEKAQKSAENAKPDFDVPTGIPKELVEHMRLMYDLLALSFRTNQMRVATYMLANEGSNRSYPMVGVTQGHHQLSHHRDDAKLMAQIQKIDLFTVEQFAYFLKKLKNIPEGEGSLLDHSLIVFGSGLGDGNRHDHGKLPIVLAGRGCGTVKTGQHLKLANETPLNNLFLSLARRHGVTDERFGDSTGELREINS